MQFKNFHGCKLALINDDRLLVYRRDSRKDLMYPGLLDMPGGGREDDESPEQCVLRELREEFGLDLPIERLTYRRPYATSHSDRCAYFFAASLYSDEINDVHFGDEGVSWQMMPIDVYLQSRDAITHLQALLRDLLLDKNSPDSATIPATVK